ncbi:hypothetical protein AVEN_28060-1 [Araneus ventricosus]|uniref:Uncharacterized protein n=1 Tax=Araneus ventricosus TaxID=182803 RepID=A0A4Y2RJ15_ARAVE|nr:hypothetical protein AVEN_28060-1 [Araneus ventricosus]
MNSDHPVTVIFNPSESVKIGGSTKEWLSLNRFPLTPGGLTKQTSPRRSSFRSFIIALLMRTSLQGSEPDSIEDPLCMWTWCTLVLPSWLKRPPAGVARKFREGEPAQVSSSSSDCCSKLRGQSQNNPELLLQDRTLK